MKKLYKYSPEQIKSKNLEDGSVYIEGWANKAIIDRGKDLISAKAWDLKNYKKNSIMLFNHDHTKPIGKMISVEAKDDGLYVKGRISNSRDPEISRVRDLVKEGILNSLSVGIMVNDEDQSEGVNHIKSVELHEISVVAVPMNQDSQFTVSTKSMGGTIFDVMSEITKQVGQADVESAYNKLNSDDQKFKNISEIAKKLANEAGISEKNAHDFLSLKLKDTPIKIKNWLSKGEDMAQEQKAETESVYAIEVQKTAVESMEELIKWAESSGWKTDAILEQEDCFLLVQNPLDMFSGELEKVDMGDGVMGLIGELKSESEGEDQPTEEMPAATEEEKSADQKPEETEAELQKADQELADLFRSQTEEAISGGDKNPPSWVADEALWEKAKRASEAALGEVSYAFVVWWYMDQGGSKKSMDTKQALLDEPSAMTQPVDGMTADQIEINPALDQAKQTNVLLSSAVALLQAINEKFNQIPVEPAPMIAEEADVSQALSIDSEEEEIAKKLESFMIKTNDRLRTLGL